METIFFPSSSQVGAGLSRTISEEHSPLKVLDLFLTKDKHPGPGSYRIPSDFGHYEAKGQENTGNASSVKFSRQ